MAAGAYVKSVQQMLGHASALDARNGLCVVAGKESALDRLVRYLVLGARRSTSPTTTPRQGDRFYDIGDAVKFSAG